jgi:hypothetical protein
MIVDADPSDILGKPGIGADKNSAGGHIKGIVDGREPDIKIFGFRRPLRCEHVFDTAAGSPARDTGRCCYRREDRISTGAAILNRREGRSASYVEQRTSSYNANAAPKGIKPSRTDAVRKSLIERRLIGRTAPQSVPRKIVLNSDDDIRHLVVAADSTAENPTSGIKVRYRSSSAPRAGRDRRISAPNASAFDTDVAASPTQSRCSFRRGRLERHVRRERRGPANECKCSRNYKTVHLLPPTLSRVKYRTSSAKAVT